MVETVAQCLRYIRMLCWDREDKMIAKRLFQKRNKVTWWRVDCDSNDAASHLAMNISKQKTVD